MTVQDRQPTIRIAGDKGILVEFGESIDPEINARVRSLAASVKENSPDGIIEIIPTYRSLLFIYDPARISFEKMKQYIRTIESSQDSSVQEKTQVVEIPVCYGDEFGPDMDTVRASAALTENEVISLHTKPEYLIYMVGFTPGFPFLGGLHEKLHTPRLKTPRSLVPEGSVGIANNQTGMYPVESPGGWQIIGRTPLRLFDPFRKNPFLYKAGDKIKFIAVSREEYNQIKQEDAK